MSDEIQTPSLEETPPTPIVITESDKRLALQNAIYRLTDQQPFYGSLLQQINIKYDMQLPTAGITFNQKLSQFEVLINPYFFLSMTNEERVAVFHHEILHFTNQHLFRLPFLDKNIPMEDKKIYNIAGDMAINQYIKNLPEGCVDYKQWKLDDGSIFPSFKNMEAYHDLIKNEAKKQQEKKDGEGKPDKNGKPGEGTKGNVNDHLDKYKEFDKHFWDSLDEETKKKMLDEAKKVVKRTIEKTSYSHTNVPDGIKDLLQEIDSLSAGINYKQILRNVIKKTISAVERENTWKKPNKRYGNYSPGTKVGNVPNLEMFADSSGSISVTELNLFLSIISNFLKFGSRTCKLGLWHTNLYYHKKYKLNGSIDKSEIESGGTDVGCVFNSVIKSKPNLTIILTDLYFETFDWTKYKEEVIFIVSKGGNKNHSFTFPKNYKVIYLEDLE